MVRLVNLNENAASVAVTAVAVEVHPGYAYPLPPSPKGFALVRGEVRQAGSGNGRQGATVEATAAGYRERYVTDGTGQWVLVVPDARTGSLTVLVTDISGATQRRTVAVRASSSVAVAPFTFP
jgi:hypothetical protein